MSDVRALRIAALLLGVVACSSAAEQPAEQECRSDDDCPTNFVCASDQGRCLPGNEAAPRAHLGFDIRERAAGVVRFRVEVDGCDCLVQEAQNIRELSLRRSRVSQQLALTVTSNEDPGVTMGAELVLTQPSRLGQAPELQRRLDQLAGADTSTDVATRQRWPRYHPRDASLPPELILWEIDPEGEAAHRYHGLKPPQTDADKPCSLDTDCCEPAGDCDPWPNFCATAVGECTAIGNPEWSFNYGYETDCDRELEGNVSVFDATAPLGAQFTPLPAANVQLRYADRGQEPFGIPVFGSLAPADRPFECQDDDDCDAPAEFCDTESAQCFVALRGLPAAEATGTSASEADEGTFYSRVYTYCDGAPNSSVERAYGVTVAPTGPLPTVNYIVDASFFPPLPDSVLRIGDEFCVPDWGPAVSLDLELVGQPRQLVGTDDQAYTCCDVGCLPATLDDVEAMPPEAPEGCDAQVGSGGGTLRLSTDLILNTDDIGDWEAADCVTPDVGPSGLAGGLSRLADCSAEDGLCRAEELAGGTEEMPREYRVRLESPAGSVVASEDFTVQLGTDVGTEPLVLSPRPRVLVHGVVDVDADICGRRDPGEDCAAREAVVIAERLRMPDEPESIPGPFFHTVSTFHDPVNGRDGAFVLPLDPGGVYVITALPAAGAEGGPAYFRVINLRADAPSTLEDQRLVLRDGVVVTLLLEQFDQRTSIEPLDRGSFLVQGSRLEHPARVGTADPFVDLNRFDECWTPNDEEPQACKIRRLIPPGSTLARSLVGQVRFTARRSGQAECTQTCPQPLADP